MYKSGEFVVKAGFGILEVMGVESMSVMPSSPKQDYYKLVTVDGKVSVNVPVSRAQVILRPIMDENSAKEIIKNVLAYKTEWIPDEKVRRKKFDELSAGGREDNLALIGTAYKRIKDGKKLSYFERSSLETAEKKVFGEIAFVLKISVDEVRAQALINSGISY